MYIQELIDIRAFLSHYNIHYQTYGKNVSGSGDWIGLNCPFCGDTGGHLGIHTASKVISCWRCGSKGKSLIQLIQLLFDCSPKEAIEKLKTFQNGEIPTGLQKPVFLHQNKTLNLPEEFKKINESHKNYLKKRNFDPDKIEKDYKIMGTSFFGSWAFRIIIPVFENGKMVTYTSRDITDMQNARYKSCPKKDEVINIKSCLYNKDTVKNIAVLVEGPTDVWRIGKGAICTFGIEYTAEQLKKLQGISRLFVFFDNEPIAQEQADKLAHEANIYIPEIINVTCNYSDPEAIPANEIPAFRKELFGKIF